MYIKYKIYIFLYTHINLHNVSTLLFYSVPKEEQKPKNRHVLGPEARVPLKQQFRCPYLPQVVPTAHRSLPLRFLDLVTWALWQYSATTFFSLIKGAGVFHPSPPPECPCCCHPCFPFLWFSLTLYFLWEAFSWSPASVSTTQLFMISLLLSLLVVLRMLNSFLTYEFVCLMVFSFYNTVSCVRERGRFVCVHSIGL